MPLRDELCSQGNWLFRVPVEEWDAWERDNPAGAEWHAADETDILARAEQLGWERPP